MRDRRRDVIEHEIAKATAAVMAEMDRGSRRCVFFVLPWIAQELVAEAARRSLDIEMNYYEHEDGMCEVEVTWCFANTAPQKSNAASQKSNIMSFVTLDFLLDRAIRSSSRGSVARLIEMKVDVNFDHLKTAAKFCGDDDIFEYLLKQFKEELDDDGMVILFGLAAENTKCADIMAVPLLNLALSKIKAGKAGNKFPLKKDAADAVVGDIVDVDVAGLYRQGKVVEANAEQLTVMLYGVSTLYGLQFPRTSPCLFAAGTKAPQPSNVGDVEVGQIISGQYGDGWRSAVVKAVRGCVVDLESDTGIAIGVPIRKLFPYGYAGGGRLDE
jgi:hypothetical protein